MVRIHNTNTGKIIVARFPVVAGGLAPEGDLEIDGVAGTAAPIRLEFIEPGGAKSGQLLPTGKAMDVFDIPGLGTVTASCIDAANPCVFVTAEDLNKTGVELPQELEEDSAFLAIMECIRLAASVRMGLAPDESAAGAIPSIPKVAMLCAPRTMRTLTGRILAETDMDISVRMISVGQPHRAVPITGAICLAVAARIPGTVAHKLCGSAAGPIRIAHASGTLLVDGVVSKLPDGRLQADYGAVYRSARRLFEGTVVFPTVML